MGRNAGFTMPEIMVVVAILGIAAALAAPRMSGMLAAARTRTAANRVATDLSLARHLAIRNGSAARLVLQPSGDCAAPPGWMAGHRYLVVAARDDSVAARVDLRQGGGRLCLAHNGPRAVTFNSRGLLVGFNNRTMVLRHGDWPADTLTLSSVGRILRRY